MYRMICTYILLIAILLPTQASADQTTDIKPKQGSINPVLGFLISEGAIAVTSSWSSERPHGFGTFLVVLGPIGLASNVSPSAQMIEFVGLESIGLYNRHIDTNKVSKSEIFRKNVIAFNVLYGLTFLTDYITGDNGDKETVTLQPLPYGGTSVAFNYKF